MAKNKFYYDAVFCVDKSINMDNQIDFISGFVNSFYEMAKSEIQNSITQVEKFRIKLITYGDFNTEDNAVTDYGFFSMPEQSEELYSVFMQLFGNSSSKQEGYTSGLEALSYAIDSEWTDMSDKMGRQAVVVFSLNKPTNIEETRNLDSYPSHLPKNLLELKQKWENGKMSKDKKMLTLFCNLEKDKSSWYPLERWDKTIAINTEDLNDFTNDFILQTLLIDIV